MFPIPFNFPFIKSNGQRTTIGAAISEGGGSYTLPTASDSTKGGVKIGSGLSMDGETLNNTNPTPYVLPTADATTKGGVFVASGYGLTITDGVLSADVRESDATSALTYSGTITTSFDWSYLRKVGYFKNVSFKALLSSKLTTSEQLIAKVGLIGSQYVATNSVVLPAICCNSDETETHECLVVIYNNRNNFVTARLSPDVTPVADMVKLYVNAFYN